MLFATTCPGCGRPGSAPCAACVEEMERAPPLPVPLGLTACRSFLVYDGAARELVAQLKYRNARSALAWLADGVAELFASAAFDVVTWAPTTGRRRRQRGFDQAELLAKAVARRVGRPSRCLLRRLPGPHQTGRSLAERRQIPGFVGAGTAGVRSRSPPGRVLLVDDVITSGATLSAAAKVLRTAGVRQVLGATAARRI